MTPAMNGCIGVSVNQDTNICYASFFGMNEAKQKRKIDKKKKTKLLELTRNLTNESHKRN